MHQNYDMKATIKYIASFIILVSSLCSCQSNTTSSMESEGNELESNIDSIANLIDIEEDTIKYFDPNDPLFGECAEYLNACAVESDKKAIEEYNESLSSPESMDHWHLLKMETVDGSPIDESTRNKLGKITFGCGNNHFVVNGCLTIPLGNMKFLNLNHIRSGDSFVNQYSEFATYFEKSYSDEGIAVSFDKIKVICPCDDTSSWLKYFSVFDFAIIGDQYHCCLVINKKYALWFSKFKILATAYDLENFKADPIFYYDDDKYKEGHFFKDPLPDFEKLAIDTTIRKIASDKTCLDYKGTEDSIYRLARGQESMYEHMIVYDLNGEKEYLGPYGRLFDSYNIIVLPDYKGYHVVYAGCDIGYDNLHFGQLIVYSDLEHANQDGTRLLVEDNYGDCEENERDGEAGCTHLFFDVYEDYTIRVRGRDVWDGVNKSITRYYRINDEGKFYEVTGRGK